MRRGHLVLFVLLGAEVITGCTSTTPSVSATGLTPTPFQTGLPAPGEPLPTLEGWPLPSNTACGGVGMGPTLTLEGTRADGVYALWRNTQKVPIQWPPGYRVVFSPSLSVLDPQGDVIATAGTNLEESELAGLLICTEGTEIQMLPL